MNTFKIAAAAIITIAALIAPKAFAFTGDGHVTAPALELIDRAIDTDFKDKIAIHQDFSGAMSNSHNLLRAFKPIDASKFFGNESRVFVFLANKNKAIGMNYSTNGDRSGLSVERGAFIGDIHAGVGVRKGAVQYGLGYVHRTIKMEGHSEDQNFIAFMFSIKAN